MNQPEKSAIWWRDVKPTAPVAAVTARDAAMSPSTSVGTRAPPASSSGLL